MYLKALTLRGFKSFATATTLKFEPGITCIVGPNGSGKSNVVDALTWVMGEQGAKSLRGGAMVDVIFAGTAGRAGLGRAQVELTIDNTDGRLPIDYSEVTMSRTLFRGGSSEYAINQSPARLLDVQELLSDTGMGRQMHVIVGQGQLDTVLNASPQERRAFIDEAAGVLKHRRRKERALRKLEAMDQNLVRVLDLTEEIRRQLKPLARQAQAAQKASGVQARILYAKRRLTSAELMEILASLQQAEASAAGVRTQAVKLEAGFQDLRAQLEVCERRVNEQRQLSQTLNDYWHGLREVAQRFDSLGELARERIRRAGGVQVPLSEASIELAEERAAECEAEAKVAEQAREQAANACQAAEKAAAEASIKAQAETQKLRAAESELNRLLVEQSRVESELARANNQVQFATDALAAARQRREEAEAQAAEAEKNLAALQPPSEQNSEMQVLAHEEAVRAEHQKREQVEEATQAARLASETLATWQARAQALSDSLAATQINQAEVPAWNVLGQLAEHVRVARGWEDAVSALLEPYGEADLVEQLSVATQAEQQAGATGSPVYALIVDKIAEGGTGGIGEADAANLAEAPEAAPAAPTVEAATQSAEVLPAASAISASCFVNTGLGTLLENTWLAANAKIAVNWLQSRGDLLAKVATPNGTVLTRYTIRTRGEGGASRLRLRADLEQAEAQAKLAKDNLAQAEAALQQAKDELAEAAALAAERMRQLRELDAQKAEQAKEFARVSALASVAKQEANRAKTQVEEAEQALQQAQTLAQELVQAAQQREPITPETFLEQARLASRQADEALSECREKLADGRVELHAADERLASARRQMQAFKTQVEQQRAERQRQLRQFEEANTMKTTAAKVLEEANAAKTRAEKLIDRVNLEREAAAQKVTQLEQESTVVQGRISEAEQRRTQLIADQQQSEVTLAGLRYQFEQVQEKAWELVEESVSSAAGTQGQEDEAAEAVAPAADAGAAASSDTNAEAGDAEGTASEATGETTGEATSDEPADVDQQLPEPLLELLAEFGPEAPWPTSGMPADSFEPAFESENQKVAGSTISGTTTTSNTTPIDSDWVPFTRELAVEALNKAQHELTRLGVVNPLAVEEYNALKSRHDFLMEQVDDLNRSKADLMKIIQDVDRRVRESFQEAFEDVSAQFAHVFSILFPGGAGKLELTDPDDPLHTGVEIEARPAGKKVTRMSLLSGGERSLASLAYLFAIFKARPSPFYVLDEIEAALDDINLSRVLQVLQELQQDSQLLIVTHQKRTMQIADALYGITMKDGVTTVISHKMREN